MTDYRFELHSVLEPGLGDLLYEQYLAAFGRLQSTAAAKHVLSLDEWRVEMSDPRIDKLVLFSPAGDGVGLMTGTSDLAAVPWVSREFYGATYPGRDMYYQGFTFIQKEHRSIELLLDLFHRALAVVPAGSVVAFDCSEGNVARGYVDSIRMAMSAEVREIDVQRYFAFEQAECVLDRERIAKSPTADLR